MLWGGEAHGNEGCLHGMEAISAAVASGRRGRRGSGYVPRPRGPWERGVVTRMFRDREAHRNAGLMVILLFLLDPKNRADHGPSSSWSVRSPRRRNNEMTASPTLSSSTYLRRSLSVTPPVKRTGRASPSEERSYTSPHCLAWSLAVADPRRGRRVLATDLWSRKATTTIHRASS